MIKTLSAIGRISIVISAAIIVFAGGVGGYFSVLSAEEYRYGAGFAISQGGVLTPTELGGIAFGAVCGLFVAGLMLGLVATVYDMRDSLRTLAAASRRSPPPAPLPHPVLPT